MESDQHTATDLSGGCARELHRISHLLTHYIKLERLFYGSASARKTEMERLCRFSTCFPYGILLQTNGVKKPAFVSATFFSLVCLDIPKPEEASKSFADVFFTKDNSFVVGEYMRHFCRQPTGNFYACSVFNSLDRQVSLFSVSDAVGSASLGGVAHIILTLFGSAELFAAQDVLCRLDVVNELELIMALTAGQYAVYRLMQGPVDNSALSDTLFCSAPTVKSHKAAIRKKIRSMLQKRKVCWLRCLPFCAKFVTKG